MQSTRKYGLIAVTPLILYLLTPLVSGFWPPLLLEVGHYSLLRIGLFTVLLVGALWGVYRRMPLWSYSWIMFCLLSIHTLVSDIAHGIGVAPATVASTIVVDLATWVVSLAVAILLGRRGVRFGLFAILLALLHLMLPFYDLRGNPYVAAATANMLTIIFAMLAVAQVAVAVVMVLRFLETAGNTQRRCLYPLAGVVLIDAVFNGWAMSMCVPANSLVAAISAVATSWGISGIGLLAVWGLSRAVASRHRKTPAI